MVTEKPADASHSSTGRIVPLFRPYRLQVSVVIVLIVVTSTIGIINPLLIQAVFNKALFIPGGPNLHLLYVLVGVMALVPLPRRPDGRAVGRQPRSEPRPPGGPGGTERSRQDHHQLPDPAAVRRHRRGGRG
jgi:hypothetical protein